MLSMLNIPQIKVVYESAFEGHDVTIEIISITANNGRRKKR